MHHTETQSTLLIQEEPNIVFPTSNISRSNAWHDAQALPYSDSGWLDVRVTPAAASVVSLAVLLLQAIIIKPTKLQSKIGKLFQISRLLATSSLLAVTGFGAFANKENTFVRLVECISLVSYLLFKLH